MAPPRILLSNDDGLDAQGLTALEHAFADIADVWVCAPDRERSAVSQSISLHHPIRVFERGPQRFAVDGTPTDAVYLALNHLMPKPPDIVVSGINRGPNLGNDVLYSGTVAAAMEGALFGYPAIALSQILPGEFDKQHGMPIFELAAQFAKSLAQSILESPMPVGVVLNVNVPNMPREKLRGTKLCRLGYTDWTDSVIKRTDPRGKPYYWIGGDRCGYDKIQDSDNAGIREGFITVTPIHYDLTDHRSLAQTRNRAIDGFSWAMDTLGDGPLGHPAHPRREGC